MEEWIICENVKNTIIIIKVNKGIFLNLTLLLNKIQDINTEKIKYRKKFFFQFVHHSKKMYNFLVLKKKK